MTNRRFIYIATPFLASDKRTRRQAYIACNILAANYRFLLAAACWWMPFRKLCLSNLCLNLFLFLNITCFFFFLLLAAGKNKSSQQKQHYHTVNISSHLKIASVFTQNQPATTMITYSKIILQLLFYSESLLWGAMAPLAIFKPLHLK